MLVPHTARLGAIALGSLLATACSSRTPAPLLPTAPAPAPAAPTLTGVTPDSGFEPGGQSVLLHGSGFVGATEPVVSFGGAMATATVLDDQRLSVLVPPGAPGTVDVTVGNAGGVDILPGAFTYYTQPIAFAASEQRVDRNPGSDVAFIPALTIDDTHVHVAWEDRRDGGSSIYANHSTDRGATWDAMDTRLDRSTSGTSFASDVQIASADGAVYATWQDNRSGDFDIYFNRSLDDGATWEALDRRLNTDTAGASSSLTPQILCRGAHVFVIWKDFRNGSSDIYFNRSADRGATWAAVDQRLDTGDIAGAANSFDARIAAAGDHVYVAWVDARHDQGAFLPSFDIYLNRSSDGGATWQPVDVRINTNERGFVGSIQPQLCAMGDRVFVVWQDGRNEPNSPFPHQDIYFNRSTDAGATWLGEDVRVERDEPAFAASQDLQLSCVGDSVYLVWKDSRNDVQPITSKHDIYLNRSTDGGLTWQQTDTRLDTDAPGSGDSVLPRICGSGGNVFVVWQDLREGRESIFFNSSADGGETWQSEDTRLDSAAPGGGLASCPQIDCDGARVYTVWADRRNGDLDVYFDRNVR